MQETKVWNSLERDLGCKLQDVDVLHKWNAQESVYIKQCHSVRVAYTTLAIKDGSSEELAHIYCAMGLQKQSE